MNNQTQLPYKKLLSLFAALALTMTAKADLTIGPLNPGFEDGDAHWNTNSTATATDYINFFNAPTNGPSGAGTNCVLEASDGTGQADLRVDMFSLAAAANGAAGVTVEFDYNILTPINFGDEIRVGFRSLDSGGGFQGENNFHIGTPNGDAGGDGWHHFIGTAVPSATGVNADIRITMNVFGDDTWSSGPVLFDNFKVTLSPTIGAVNGTFENGGANWNTGGSVSFVNAANGPSEPGTNCVALSSTGGGGNADLRVNEFSVGAASGGAQSVSVDFDYNILSPINSGDQIRVGFRSEDSNGNFQGEHNFHIGSPNADVGGTGWHHFHGVTVPIQTSAVVGADIRITMNVFGDDTWSSGTVYFDNFVLKLTSLFGPNNNGDFENQAANWNGGGPGGSAGSVTGTYPANGPSAPGTNCAMMTADGTVGPPNGNDIRANSFTSPVNGKPYTITFDYNILNHINNSDEVRIGLRFYDNNGNFQGEFNSHIGVPNGDVGGQGWKHFAASVTPPANTLDPDIRMTMNIFGDDIWSSGPVLFDNIYVYSGTTTTNNMFTSISGSGNNYLLNFSGTPLTEYILQLNSSVSAPAGWMAQTTNLTDINGNTVFTGTSTNSSAFWRTKLVQ